jgi:hypothetical protein
MKYMSRLNYCKISTNIRERCNWKKEVNKKTLTEKSLLEYVLIDLQVICMVPDFCGEELGKTVDKIFAEFFKRHSIVCK